MRIVILLSFLVISFSANAQEFIELWPEGKMPNSKGMQLEREEERQRVTQVDKPGMYAFFPALEERNGASILIIPGGGYHHLTYDLGGFQYAKWLNTLGISAFVLIHRLPTSPDLVNRQQGPIQDAQRAIKIVRKHAGEWSLDPTKTGVLGTSAGGHLASTVGTHFTDFSKIGDDLDKVDFHLNFMILISPVISLGEYTHEGSRDNFLGEQPENALVQEYSNQFHVSDKTPPSFLAHAQDDPAVSALNSILFYQEMMKHDVKGSLHIFPKGEHKIGIYNSSRLTDKWKELTKLWLEEMKLVP